MATLDPNCRQKKNCGPAGTPASQCAQKANARLIPTFVADPAPADNWAPFGGLRQPTLVSWMPAGASGQWLLVDALRVN